MRIYLLLIITVAMMYTGSHAFVASPEKQQSSRRTTTALRAFQNNNNKRRRIISSFTTIATASLLFGGDPSLAADSSSPVITDKIFIDLKSPTDTQSSRIVIGLYGKEAPKATKMLKQLVSATGLPVKCKPREEGRILQKEQLQANKVYNSCIENESRGVTYEYGTVWRIIKDSRIDVGAVSGKFIAREFPNWDDDANSLPHKMGSVSVQRGNESGFGFTIQPTDSETNDLQNTNVVVGQIIEGLDVMAQLNDTPVVVSSKSINYMGLTGNDGMKSAPTRSCSYGTGNFYCNEFKPLKKLSIVSTGVVKK